MKTIFIFGGTGFIGQSLAKQLDKHGYEPVLVARNKPKESSYPFLQWNGYSLGDWTKELNNALAVVNLAGKSVDCIKTPDHCDTILRSRVNATRAIGKALQNVQNPPKIWIQMSTAHIYGDSLTHLCTEEDATGYGLAPFVGKRWEQALDESIPADCRRIILRTSFVLGKHGGALQQLKRITKLGLGGKVGHGKQGISWIHEHDFNQIVIQAIEDEEFKGIYIASAPNPVSNRDFMKALRKSLKIPFGLPSPAWITKIGAKHLFKTDSELALYGRYVTSKRLKKQGFAFQFPDLEDALFDLM